MMYNIETGVNSLGDFAFGDDLFAEIEFDTGTAANYELENSAEMVPPPLSIRNREDDHIRRLICEMRGISSENPYENYSPSIFYKQALFMENFNDYYEGYESLNILHPNYQRMGFEQLRTYFTFRTKARNGEFCGVSLSYVFLYAYELLMNIGVKEPMEGFNRLCSLWNYFRGINPLVNDYFPLWIKDYYVFYDLPGSFISYIEENNYQAFYPEYCQRGDENILESWYHLSSYDIKESKFYKNGNEDLVNGCLTKVFKAVQGTFSGTCLDKIFLGSMTLYPWRPFRLSVFFYPDKLRDRIVEMPDGEIYICENNSWKVKTTIRDASAKDAFAYIIKKAEGLIREELKFKHKLKVNKNMILLPLYHTSSHYLREYDAIVEKLDETIVKAVKDYFIALTRTVVKVKAENLARIRKEALGTQEKLTVPEEISPVPGLLTNNIIPVSAISPDVSFADSYRSETLFLPGDEGTNEAWIRFMEALSPVESEALAIILKGGNIKLFADSENIMLEVLTDMINEKAVDYIGDSILEFEEDITVFEEYREIIAEMVG